MARKVTTTENISEAPATPPVSKYPFPGVDNEYVRVDRFPIGGDEERMYQHLSSQPKVSFFIPLNQGETKGAVASPQVNGLRVNIRKGVMVELPKQLAEHMAESLNLTIEAQESPTVTNVLTGQTKNARLDKQSEADQAALA